MESLLLSGGFSCEHRLPELRELRRAGSALVAPGARAQTQ